MPLKRCPKCGETKPFEAFSKCKSNRDGLQGNCKDCRRRYREANRDAEQERNRRYREANRDALLERKRRYHEANRDAELERNRRYYEANRDAVLERQRRYYEENSEAIWERNRRYYEANRDAEQERHRRYREENQDITAEVANRKNQPWTEAEDAYLMSSSDQITVQAVELGRTHSSVEKRRTTLRKKAKASA